MVECKHIVQVAVEMISRHCAIDQLRLIPSLMMALWLVMQVFVPVLHNHCDHPPTRDEATAQWSVLQDDASHCAICSLLHSPAAPTADTPQGQVAVESNAQASAPRAVAHSALYLVPSFRAPPAI